MDRSHSELTERGFSDQDIQKMLGGNFLRVLGKTWRE